QAKSDEPGENEKEHRKGDAWIASHAPTGSQATSGSFAPGINRARNVSSKAPSPATTARVKVTAPPSGRIFWKRVAASAAPVIPANSPYRKPYGRPLVAPSTR